MARNTEFYDINENRLLVGGVLIQDLMDGEPIAFEIEGDDKSITRGMDANKFNFGSPRPAAITVQLKPTSASIDYLENLANNAFNGRPTLIPTLLTTGVEDRVVMPESAVQSGGFNTGGQEMSARTYIIRATSYQQVPL